MVGKGVKLQDVIFHIVHLLLVLLLEILHSFRFPWQDVQRHTKKFINPLLSVSH